MVSGISGSERSQDWLNSIFKKVDANADGQVSKEEFQDAFANILAEKLLGKNGISAEVGEDELFAMIDQDQDGSISKEEFARFMEAQRKMPPPPVPFGQNMLDFLMVGEASDIFSEIDADKDGAISQAEFVAYIEKQKAVMFSAVNTGTEVADSGSVSESV